MSLSILADFIYFSTGLMTLIRRDLPWWHRISLRISLWELDRKFHLPKCLWSNIYGRFFILVGTGSVRPFSFVRWSRMWWFWRNYRILRDCVLSDLQMKSFWKKRSRRNWNYWNCCDIVFFWTWSHDTLWSIEFYHGTWILIDPDNNYFYFDDDDLCQ